MEQEKVNKLETDMSNTQQDINALQMAGKEKEMVCSGIAFFWIKFIFLSFDYGSFCLLQGVDSQVLNPSKMYIEPFFCYYVIDKFSWMKFQEQI